MPQGLGAGGPMDQRAIILSLGDAGAAIVARIGPRLPGNPRLVSCIHDQRLEQSDVSGDLSQGVLRLRFHHVVPLDETLRGLDLAMAPATRLHVIAALGGAAGSAWVEDVARFPFLNLDLQMVHCVTPFTFEGAKRKRNADAALAHLRATETPLRTYANQDLCIDARHDESFSEAFGRIDSAIVDAITRQEQHG